MGISVSPGIKLLNSLPKSHPIYFSILLLSLLTNSPLLMSTNVKYYNPRYTTFNQSHMFAYLDCYALFKTKTQITAFSNSTAILRVPLFMRLLLSSRKGVVLDLLICQGQWKTIINMV